MNYILIVTKSKEDAFTSLFFDGLPPELRQHMRIMEFGRESLTAGLAGASAVIVMRHGLFSFGNLSACAGLLGVPRYYFLDDNLLLLRDEPEVYGPYWTRYTDDNVRQALRGYAGVLLASRPLIAFFSERKLHSRMIPFPPIAGAILRERERAPDGSPFRVAFFGGEHRRDLIVGLVYPALQRLAAQRPVEFVPVGMSPDLFPPAPGLSIVSEPYELSYEKALAQLARRRIDVLVHPTPPSRNNPYKNANVVINARSIGAVAVLSNLPPYDTFGPQPPAQLCENDPDSWYGAMNRLAADRPFADAMFARSLAYCEEEFSGAPNTAAIAGILADHVPPGALTRATRRVVGGVPLEGDRLNATARRIVRSRLS